MQVFVCKNKGGYNCLGDDIAMLYLAYCLFFWGKTDERQYTKSVSRESDQGKTAKI